MDAESEGGCGIPLVDAYARDKATSVDTTDDQLAWYPKVDGQAVQDAHEGGPVRLPVDIRPGDLIDAVCPVDGREHQIDAVLRGGKQRSIKMIVKLGAHRRMPAAGPAASNGDGAGSYPIETFLRPPDAAWTGLLDLTQKSQTAMWQAQHLERQAHVGSLQQTLGHMHAQTAQLMAESSKQTALMLAQGAATLQAIAASLRAPAPVAAEAGAGAAAAPDFMGQLMTHGMGLLGMAEKAMGMFGVEAKDLKGLVGKLVGGVAAAEGGEIKRELASHFGTSFTVLADAVADGVRHKFGAPPAPPAPQEIDAGGGGE